MSDRHKNWLWFTTKTTSTMITTTTTTTTTKTTTDYVRWEIINMGFNTAVQILACSLPSSGH